MAARGWGGSVALALGVAAGCAAAQLGLGYGLGIISWSSATDQPGERVWLASLAWTAWIAATSTVLGAIVADRLPSWSSAARRPASALAHGGLAITAWRLLITLTAAIGALLTVPLVAVPARAAHRPETSAPQLIAGGYAIVGVVVGLVIAILAVSARAIATNVVATTSWLWALAIASVIHGVATGQGLSTAQLAVWRFADTTFIRGAFSAPGAALMLGVALVIGALAAWPAGRRGDNKVGMAISGAAGPLLVAAAYFLAAPTLVGARADDQLSAYLLAPYAVLAGLAGSVALAALVTQREQRRSRAAAEVPAGDPLAQDAYAPARAYQPDTAPALATVDVASAKAPLWPDPPDTGTQSKPAKARKSGKGKARNPAAE